MNRRLLRSDHAIGDFESDARSMFRCRCLRRGGASSDIPRDRRTSAIGYNPATEADRWAHLRKSLGRTLAVMAIFWATIALLVALISAVGSS